MSMHDNRAGRAGRHGRVVLALVAFLGLAGAACAEDVIEVQMDSAKLLKLPEGTDTIVVGNPLIADVSLQRSSVLVVTGKAYGTTNMIALDKKGAIVSESRIVVMTPQKDRLVVMRGGEKETYSCNPDCGEVMQMGDGEKFYKRTIEQARDRMTAIKNYDAVQR